MRGTIYDQADLILTTGDPNPMLTRKTQRVQEEVMVARKPYIHHMIQSERLGIRLATVLRNVADKKLTPELEK